MAREPIEKTVNDKKQQHNENPNWRRPHQLVLFISMAKEFNSIVQNKNSVRELKGLFLEDKVRLQRGLVPCNNKNTTVKLAKKLLA